MWTTNGCGLNHAQYYAITFITCHNGFITTCSAIQHKSEGVQEVKPARDVLFFSSSTSFDHVNTSVRCTLGENCGQSAAWAFIDLFTSIFLALLKLFTSDTPLYILQDPRELWLRPLWAFVCVCVCFNYTTQPLLHLVCRGQGLP